jgi:lipoprotein-releasing system permease protein
MKLPFFLFLGIRGSIQQGRVKGLPPQLRGAILGIGLSIIPLIVVIVVTNGMIEGITQRYIEITTYHLQLSLYNNIPRNRLFSLAGNIRKLDDVRAAFVEQSGSALIRSKKNLSGVTVRAIPKTLYDDDQGFKEFIRFYEGGFNLSRIPYSFEESLFKRRVLGVLTKENRRLVLSCYDVDKTSNHFVLKHAITDQQRIRLEEIFSDMRTTTILLGKNLADTLNVDVGDQVYILSLTDFHSNIVMKSSRCIVSGIFSTGYQDIDKFLAYIPQEAGSRILPETKSKLYIGIKVKDPFADMGEIIGKIKTLLTDDDIVFSRFETWYELQENQYKAFSTTKAILIFIMILIILVASWNVYSSVVMIVMEKTQEIAILKSMGVSPRTVSLSFLTIGSFTGLVGTIIGIAAGLLVAMNINEVIGGIELIVNRLIGLYDIVISPFIPIKDTEPFMIFNPDFYLEKIPVRISLSEVFTVGFLTILLSTLAAYLPAKEAGRIKPLEVIRKY